MSGDEWQGVVATAQELIGALTAAQGVLEQAAKEVDEQKQTRLEGLRQAAMRLAGTVSLECQANAEGTVHWCETSASRSRRSHSQQDRVVLHRTPIDVADLLRERLWANTERAILTSATLTASGSFSYLRSRLGLDEELDEHVIGSPFDYRSQALLYVPGHLPAPEREPTREYYDRVAEEIARIVKLSRGRAFLLFTSRRALDEAHVRLISALPFPLFRQGDMPPAKLLKAFRESECGCLLGNQTFWEGVDVQGEALSVVVIDRIPFAVPDSPITKARTDAIEAAGGNSFFDYSLPQAQIRLKQGFGRLIRTRTDRGIVCILDSRIHTKRYGEEIVRNLPAASRASIWSRVERFWNG
ncbi:MAG: hypothetical protein GX446_13540 [Chthonomonadales bacterium]|nr:hypothetical protein [Chthonomonadales bacterium]